MAKKKIKKKNAKELPSFTKQAENILFSHPFLLDDKEIRKDLEVEARNRSVTISEKMIPEAIRMTKVYRKNLLAMMLENNIPITAESLREATALPESAPSFSAVLPWMVK